jgi:hypothetical protein
MEGKNDMNINIDRRRGKKYMRGRLRGNKKVT